MQPIVFLGPSIKNSKVKIVLHLVTDLMYHVVVTILTNTIDHFHEGEVC